jgi:hypothetical protein
VNTALKGKRLQGVENIKKNVMAEVKAVPVEAFADCSKKFKRFYDCTQVGGDYCEQK